MAHAPDPTDPPGRTMPPDFSIAVRPATGTDIGPPGAQGGERRQPMRGFEDTYTDIVDYIVGITHRIWEDQDIGYVYDSYAPGCFVYDDSGAHYGVERIVEATIGAIHAFPDTRSFADEVIWAGDDDQGFVTSHRYITTGHHLAPWCWGPATGNRRTHIWGINQLYLRAGRITEDWMMFNEFDVMAQILADEPDPTLTAS